MKTYADIVFAATSSGTGPKEKQGGTMNILLYLGKSVLVAAALGAAAAMDLEQDDLTLARTLIIVAAALTVVQFLASMTTRHTVLRIIPCPHVQGGHAAFRALSGIIRFLLTLCLAAAYLMMMTQTRALKGANLLEVAFLFRAFARAFHDPLGASIESLALLYYDEASYLCLFAFLLHRARVLFNQVVYMAASVGTAIKNKK